MPDHLIIDFHTYLGHDPFGDYAQSADELVATMDQNDIAMAVVAQLVDTPGPVPDANQALEAARRRFPHRLIPFARIDPRYGDRAVAEFESAVDELGFRGLVFNPVSTNSLAYHRGVHPLMRAAADRGVPVIIPAGHAYLGLPEQIARLAALIPELAVIVGHMGAAQHAVRAIELATEHPNLFLETSLQQSTHRLPLAVDKVGADRVLFGSAAPYGHPTAELLKVKVAGLDPGTLGKVLGRNAAAILGMAVEEAQP
jgi:predicted TIM-barrel fold metal-dependent hydrolase